MKNSLVAASFLLLFIKFNGLFAQVPVISYSGPKTYAVGTPVTPLPLVNTGGVVPGLLYGQVTTNPNATAVFLSYHWILKAPDGNFFVNDGVALFKLDTLGNVKPFAGTADYLSEIPDDPLLTDGVGTKASFGFFNGMAINSAGYIFVADGIAIRKISPDAVVTTLTGSRDRESADAYGHIDGPAGTARFEDIRAIALDKAGNIFVGDKYYIRKITPDGTVSTYAGSGTQGSANGAGTVAQFSNIEALAIDSTGNIFVADGYKIRKITSSKEVSTFAGSDTPGSDDGAGIFAKFYGISGLAADALGNIYVTDRLNSKVRKIIPSGIVTTLAGSGTVTHANGVGQLASFRALNGGTIDSQGSLYVTDNVNYRHPVVRKIATVGYSINPALPAGLSLNRLNGAISGTPTAATPAQTYIIKGYNTAGADTAGINISVIYPPVLSKNTATTHYYTTAGTAPIPVIIDTKIEVTDHSRDRLSAATVALTTNFTATEDALAFSNTSAMGNITGVYNNATGVLSLTSAGATATLSQWQQALRAVTYNNTNNVTPNLANRTVTFVIKNGPYSSNTIHKLIDLSYKLSPEAELSSIKLSPETELTVIDRTDALNTYTASVANSVTGISVIAVTKDTRATIKVNGVAVNSGASSGTLTLSPGDNIINTVVTAQDGKAKKTYRITVNRAGNSLFALHSLADNNIGGQLQTTTIVVHPSLSPNGDGINDVLLIDGITNYADNKLTLMNNAGSKIFEMNGYDNVNKVFNGYSNITQTMQKPGTYYYLLEYKDNGEQKSKTGFFLIKY